MLCSFSDINHNNLFFKKLFMLLITVRSAVRRSGDLISQTEFISVVSEISRNARRPGCGAEPHV